MAASPSPSSNPWQLPLRNTGAKRGGHAALAGSAFVKPLALADAITLA